MIYCNLFGWINLKEPFYRARFGRDYLLWNLAFGKLSNHSIFLCKIWRLINYFKYWVIDYLNWEKNYLMHNISKWSGTLWKSCSSCWMQLQHYEWKSYSRSKNLPALQLLNILAMLIWPCRSCFFKVKFFKDWRHIFLINFGIDI